MFQIFKIPGKRFKFSNNIRAPKLSNIQYSRFGLKIQIRIQIIRSSLALKSLTWYPPLIFSSLGFSVSLQMLNSTLPIPLPTTPVSPSDSTTVWTQFEIESEKKVVNKSGKPNAHKPTFNPIIMYLKCSSQWRIL